MRKQKMVFLTCGLSMLFCSVAFAGWEQAEPDHNRSSFGSWKYEQDGEYLSNQWMKNGRYWYYLGADGVTLSQTTQTIDGVDYTFTSWGEWTKHSKLQEQENQVIYTNLDFNYSISFNKEEDSDYLHNLYNIGGAEALSYFTYIDDGEYLVVIKNYPRFQFPNFTQDTVKSILHKGTGPGGEIDVIKTCAPVHVNGLTFEKKYVGTSDSSGYMILYTCIEEDGAIVITVTSYHHEMGEEKSSEIVAAIKGIRKKAFDHASLKTPAGVVFRATSAGVLRC